MKLKQGDRVVWNGGLGTFLRYSPNGQIGYLHWDKDRKEDGTYPFEQEDDANEIELAKPLTLEDVAEAYGPTDQVELGPFGYVVTPDGVVYCLRKQWAHGIVMAILYPDIAAKHGFHAPHRGAANVFEFQNFELEHYKEMPCVRISSGYSRGLPRVSFYKAATPVQAAGVRRALQAMGHTLNDELEDENSGDITLRTLLKRLEEGYE